MSMIGDYHLTLTVLLHYLAKFKITANLLHVMKTSLFYVKLNET